MGAGQPAGAARRKRSGRALLVAIPALLVALAAPSALAHGGQYKSPLAPGDDGGGSGGGGRSGGGRRSRSSFDDRRTGADSWEEWWWSNRDRYLDLARRIRDREREASTGGLGATAGGIGPAAPAAAVRDPRLFHEAEILPVVTRALSDPDAEVRSAAAVALGKMGFARSFVDLQKALHDAHPDVRDGALLALGMVREPMAVETLRAALRDTEERERTRGFAALALGLLGGDDATATLLRFLAPEADAEKVGGLRRSGDAMACAVLGLGFAGSATAREELRRGYASGKRMATPLRAFASISLARLGDRESIPLLLKGLRHQDAAMRQCAATALGVLGRPADDAVVEALAGTAREESDEGARHLARLALGRIGGEAALGTLRSHLAKCPDREVPFLALALGTARDRASAPALRRLFRESAEAGNRGALAISLGLLGDGEAAADLREAAADRGNEPRLRGYCLTALGLLGDAEVAATARKILLEEALPRLKLDAAVCLGLLGDREAVEALTRTARGGDGVTVRAHACYFLGLIGGNEAGNVLVQVAGDRSVDMLVRMNAVAALGVLADRSPRPLLSGLNADGNCLIAVDPLAEVANFL